VCLEIVVVTCAHGDTYLALGHVLAFDGELVTVNGADSAVWEIERHVWQRIFGEVVVRLEFMQELGGGDDIKVSLIAA
jgi:hypothetical protein